MSEPAKYRVVGGRLLDASGRPVPLVFGDRDQAAAFALAEAEADVLDDASEISWNEQEPAEVVMVGEFECPHEGCKHLFVVEGVGETEDRAIEETRGMKFTCPKCGGRCVIGPKDENKPWADWVAKPIRKAETVKPKAEELLPL